MKVVADTRKKRRQLSGVGRSWSVVVALHRHSEIHGNSWMG